MQVLLETPVPWHTTIYRQKQWYSIALHHAALKSCCLLYIPFPIIWHYPSYWYHSPINYLCLRCELGVGKSHKVPLNSSSSLKSLWSNETWQVFNVKPNTKLIAVSTSFANFNIWDHSMIQDNIYLKFTILPIYFLTHDIIWPQVNHWFSDIRNMCLQLFFFNKFLSNSINNSSMVQRDSGIQMMLLCVSLSNNTQDGQDKKVMKSTFIL